MYITTGDAKVPGKMSDSVVFEQKMIGCPLVFCWIESSFYFQSTCFTDL